MTEKEQAMMRGIPALIIDDETSVLEGLRIFLEDEGYEVYEARDGTSGLALFRKVNPGLVITDLRMPGMSGFDLIAEMRKIDQHTPIIVLTGYGSMESAIDAIHLKVFDFLTKPIDLDALKTAIDRAHESVQTAQGIQKEVKLLREELGVLQSHLGEQMARISELEPFIQSGRLLAGVLHDLNNPLMYIMGQAELLQILHPEVENINAIKQQAQRMKNILTTIIQKLKASQNRRLEWIQINELLRDEVAFLECHPFFRKEIEKEWHLSAGLPPLRGVPSEISQVFGNLLRNAAEAVMGQSVKIIKITTWHDSSGIHISIQDTGPGIPAHLREKIFQPFFTTKGVSGGVVGGMGMGIGLYHCRELVNQYGGVIEVLSQPGLGANFVVHFPSPVADLLPVTQKPFDS